MSDTTALLVGFAFTVGALVLAWLLLAPTRRRAAHEYRWNSLATYNAEAARGVTHTPEYVERMAVEQATFDQAQRAGWEADTNTTGLICAHTWSSIPDPGGYVGTECTRCGKHWDWDYCAHRPTVQGCECARDL